MKVLIRLWPWYFGLWEVEDFKAGVELSWNMLHFVVVMNSGC